jgi:hypothetical protein
MSDELSNADVKVLLGSPSVDRRALDQFLVGYDRKGLQEACEQKAGLSKLDVWVLDPSMEWTQLPSWDLEQLVQASAGQSLCRAFFVGKLGLDEEQYLQAKEALNSLTPMSPAGIYFNPQTRHHAMVFDMSKGVF